MVAATSTLVLKSHDGSIVESSDRLLEVQDRLNQYLCVRVYSCVSMGETGVAQV